MSDQQQTWILSYSRIGPLLNGYNLSGEDPAVESLFAALYIEALTIQSRTAWRRFCRHHKTLRTMRIDWSLPAYPMSFIDGIGRNIPTRAAS